MDKHKALELFSILKRQSFLEYTITDFINNGKSAAVFKAIDALNNAIAIKIFDNDLIERFGHEIQERRIQQEISLVGHAIPNLIKIINGNKQTINGSDYYFIAMEFLEGKNLKEFIKTENYDDNFLRKVTKVLIDTTEELLKKGIAHRDIKPENIMVTPEKEIILLDLGVLKFVGAGSFSDQDEMQFVGTLSYAPPEFLTRTEANTEDGWRAINLYQIGGVLHDLIMKKELFKDRVPYPKLVLAIKEDNAYIYNPDFSYDSNQLARDLLIKNWSQRLQICTLSRIHSYCDVIDKAQKSLKDVFDEFHLSVSENKLMFQEIDGIKRSNDEKERIKKDISNKLIGFVDAAMNTIKKYNIFSKYDKRIITLPIIERISGGFNINHQIPPLRFEMKSPKIDSCLEITLLYEIEGEIVNGFIKPILLLMRLENDENSFCRISVSGLIFGTFIMANKHTYEDFFINVVRELLSINGNIRCYQIDTTEVLSGVVTIDGVTGKMDRSTGQELTRKIFEIIKKGIDIQMPEAKQKLEWTKQNSLGVNTSHPEHRIFNRTIIF